jgi:hypothetical protein
VTDGANSFRVSTAPDTVKAVARIEGSWTNPDTQLYLRDWTTSAANSIKVYTTGEARHNGKWTPTAHRIVEDDSNGIYIRQAYAEIDGLQVYVTDTASQGLYAGSQSDGGGEWRVHHCIFIGESLTTANPEGVYFNNSATTGYLWNTVIAGFLGTSTTYSFHGGNGPCYVFNCTVYGASGGGTYGYGMRGAEIVNCATFNNGTVPTGGDFYSTGGPEYCGWDGKNVQGGDAAANSVDWAGDSNLWDAVFADRVNSDFSLNDYDGTGAIIGMGHDDPGSVVGVSTPFSDDIAGNPRTSPWDIGAFEYAAATEDTGGSTILVR